MKIFSTAENKRKNGLRIWHFALLVVVSQLFPCLCTALAAVFAAIPFVGPYWASFPGVVDLWLVQDQGLAAIGFFLAHMLPSYVVDTAIYSEIKEWVLLILPFCLFVFTSFSCYRVGTRSLRMLESC